MEPSTETVDVAVVAEHPTRNRLLAGILALLVLHAFEVAAVLVVPFLLAVLLSLMLSPAVRFLCDWSFPRVLAVVLVMLLTLTVVGSLLASLAGPARDWAEQVPTSIGRIEHALSALRSPLREATEAGEQLARLTDIDDESRLQRVVAAGPSRMAQMLQATPAALGSLVATLVLIFIFLVKGDGLLRKLVELAPALHLKKDIVIATRSAQSELSNYMVTITAINATLGMLLAAALWGLGVDTPLLWGGVAAILNFVPFVGPMLVIVILTVVGFGQFEALLPALAVPAAFVLLNALEELVTPQIVGRRLALDPVVVFLALMLCGWLWGPAGLLLAMPLLTCVRIIAERVPNWSPLAKLLSS
jgi:predicted PurR-regulated permease PerM